METEKRLSADEIRSVIADAMSRANFDVRPPLRLMWRHEPTEEVCWELFQGRALDRGQTREKQVFESWNIAGDADGEPILSVKLDHRTLAVHVTRGVLSRAWEAYSDENGAILSRQVVRRVRELVGTIDAQASRSLDDFGEELQAALQQSVVGTSRLPLTSVESPLPEFQTGHFHFRASASERALEFQWRCGALPADRRLLDDLAARHGGKRVLAELATVLNDASLSPVTGWFENLFRTIGALESARAITSEDAVDFCTQQMHLLFRHLNAFDLVQFHHRGANYPDAVLLERLLGETLHRAVQSPQLFSTATHDECVRSRVRRRRIGLLEGWLLYDRYRGHCVPDRPTSPGENERVLRFAEIEHVPEEQILDPRRRTQRLFQSDIRERFAVADIMRAAVCDLVEPCALYDLGTALFLDRPFGIHKRPGEPDRTPLLSYVAFSHKIVLQWLDQARKAKEAANMHGPLDEAAKKLRELHVYGIERAEARFAQRPGVASLEDATMVSDDFRFQRLTPRAVRLVARFFDLAPLQQAAGVDLAVSGGMLLRSVDDPFVLDCFDRDCRLRAKLSWQPDGGSITRRGVELPATGMTITQIADAEGRLQPVRDRELRLLPRR